MRNDFYSVIAFLRFPLILLVVCIHAHVSDMYELPGFSSGADRFISYYLASGAVPTFFFISGYLFCRNGLSIESYQYKLKKRIHTLLVPFILWSLIAFAKMSVCYLPQFSSVFPNLHNVPYNWHLFWMSFVDRPVPEGTITNHTPLNFPLWYVRDLMVLVIISPVLYCLRKYSTIVLSVLTIICSYFYVKTYEYQFNSLLFFAMGLYYPPQENSFQSGRARPVYLIPALGFYLLLCYLCECVVDGEFERCLRMVIITYLIPLFFFIGRICVERGIHVKPILADSTFFIFCIHGIFVEDIKNVFCKVLKVQLYIPEIVLFTTVVFLTISISVFLYIMMQKLSPKSLAVLCGGRMTINK